MEYATIKNSWTSSDLYQNVSVPPDAKTHFRWSNRQKGISPDYVNQILLAEPRASLVYNLPLWRLLEQEIIAEPEIEALLGEFRKNYGPNELMISSRDFRNKSELRYATISSRTVQGNQCIRFGLTAFIETLAEARLVESEKGLGEVRWFEFDDLVRDLFRAVAYIGRIPWLKRDFLLLCDALVNLHLRAPRTCRSFHPDPRVLMGHQQQSVFEPCESWWFESVQPSFHYWADPIVDDFSPLEYSNIYELLGHYETEDANSYRSIIHLTQTRCLAPFTQTFYRFLALVNQWQLGRHTWEPILNLRTHHIQMWMSGGIISPEAWGRVSKLTALAQELEQGGFGNDDQRALIRKMPNRGPSPLQLLEHGQADSAIETCRSALA